MKNRTVKVGDWVSVAVSEVRCRYLTPHKEYQVVHIDEDTGEFFITDDDGDRTFYTLEGDYHTNRVPWDIVRRADENIGEELLKTVI